MAHSPGLHRPVQGGPKGGTASLASALEEGGIPPSRLFQSGFEQPLKGVFARLDGCFFEQALVRAGELLFLLVQEK